MISPGSANPTNSMRTGATVLAKEVCGLVDWVIVQRLRALQHGWNKLDPTTARAACDKLRAWLNNNPTPSAATMRLFWHTHGHTLRYLTPPNGRTRLERLQHILETV